MPKWLWDFPFPFRLQNGCVYFFFFSLSLSLSFENRSSVGTVLSINSAKTWPCCRQLLFCDLCRLATSSKDQLLAVCSAVCSIRGQYFWISFSLLYGLGHYFKYLRLCSSDSESSNWSQHVLLFPNESHKLRTYLSLFSIVWTNISKLCGFASLAQIAAKANPCSPVLQRSYILDTFHSIPSMV
jgi:hypothetical protein